MAVLHMTTEDVDEKSRVLLRTSTDMLDRIDALAYSTHSLETSWQGGSASNFVGEFKNLVLQLQSQVQKLDDLSAIVEREVQQWLDADAVKGTFTDFFGNLSLSLSDAERLFAGGYLATTLRWSPLRPNSLIMTGPNWMREAVGIKAATRVIQPGTLVKQMALLAYAANVVEGVGAARDTFLDPRYAGTTRAVPAAAVDGIVKTALLVAGTTVLVGVTAAIATISAPTVLGGLIIGGAIIGTWVVGGYLIDQFVQTPLWEAWKTSYVRDQAIEWGTRQVNSVKNFVEQNVQAGVQSVKQAFGGFIQNLFPSAT